MASTSAALVDAITTALQRVAGVSPYTYDLSVAGAVQYGIYDGPPSKTAPVFVGFYEDVLEDDPADMPLTKFGRLARYVIDGYVVAAKGPTARAKAAMDLRADIMEALERGLHGRPTDVPVGGDLATVNSAPLTMVIDASVAIDGAAINLGGRGACRLNVSLSWRESWGS